MLETETTLGRTGKDGTGDETPDLDGESRFISGIQNCILYRVQIPSSLTPSQDLWYFLSQYLRVFRYLVHNPRILCRKRPETLDKTVVKRHIEVRISTERIPGRH